MSETIPSDEIKFMTTYDGEKKEISLDDVMTVMTDFFHSGRIGQSSEIGDDDIQIGNPEISVDEGKLVVQTPVVLNSETYKVKIEIADGDNKVTILSGSDENREEIVNTLESYFRGFDAYFAQKLAPKSRAATFTYTDSKVYGAFTK
ncbi:hypothetical protein KKE34_05610 [Patescibacteria group bacterium]|nr:hypothetical protein [Patescibacteria group bacterium]MBU1886048.1 hypothetical protein [Patescibacteria group bacterium]